ncbi:MAG: HAMP domain-containing methyl-accepting chemotaxis protein [Sporomusaceae bacterium]|nr:HAMP domain-containing methyl-accepting chemotaxis protein [Sporomusaceae bacterium]
MSKLTNLKVAYKLAIIILTGCLALCVVGYAGYAALQQANTTIQSMNEQLLIPIDDYGKLRVLISNANAYLLEEVLTADAARGRELAEMMTATSREVDDLYARVSSHRDDHPETALLLARLDKVKDQYRQVRGEIIRLTEQNQKAAAYTLYQEQMAALSVGYVNAAAAVSDHYTQLAADNSRASQADFRLTTYRILAVIAAAVILLTGCGLLITRSITTPLTQMVLACRDFAAGDFRQQRRTSGRRDEIGQLDAALETARAGLQRLLQQVSQSAEQVAASSQQLTASADQVATTANIVASSAVSIAGDLQTQLSDTTAAAAAIEELSASADQIAVNIQSAAANSAQTARQAAQGKEGSSQSAEQMTALEQTVISSAAVVAKLGESSKEIGQIVDTIAGIAGQTNLLALNAAIEAARAGEQGRGFAVVAEEVRKLAEQSQEAAKKIAALIGDIQADTEKAVLAMQTGSSEVRQGVQSVHASSQSFQSIVQATSLISSQIDDIARTASEMAAGAVQAAQSAKQVEDLSKNASAQTQSISASAEQQLASMQEIAAAGNALAKLSESLLAAIQKFQV